MSFGWTGEKTRLVPLDRERHFDNCVTWINDPQVTEWTLMGDFPLTKLAEEDWFQQRSKAGLEDIVFALETLAGEHIGLTGAHRIDYRNGFALTGTLIGRREMWGQGYGSDAVAVRTRYLFDVVGLRLLLSEVMEGNIGSYKVLQRNGYREVGRIPRRNWKRGAFRDLIQMVRERDPA
ncbi:hypothetical protein RAS1_36130 [Phycisphaerae bacterium RAS1]|nr:hypothetical protein RAS1_36130 [Phycisphaerae bacterium RAS1]